MSNPSFSNIDLWLFELAEGNLSPSQVEQLELFLLQHPELDVDKDVWEMVRVSPKPVVYEGIADLQKSNKSYYILGGAAAVLLLVGSVFFLDFTPELQSGRSPHSSLLPKNGINSVDEKVIRPSNPNFGNAGQDLNSISGNETIQGLDTYSNTANGEYISTTSLVVSVENENGERNANMANTEFLRWESTGNRDEDERKFDAKTNETPVFGSAQRNGDQMEGETLAKSGQLGTHFHSDSASAQDWTHTDLNQMDSISVVSQGRANTIAQSAYKMTWKSRANRLARNIQRMMDNPVALKNYRDPNFLLPGMLGNDVNMSLAGGMLAPRVQTLSRLQWSGQENEQLMNQLALDSYVYGLRGGLAVQINHQLYQNGALNIAQAAITYSPKFSVSRSISVEPSLRFKMGNKSLSASKLKDVDRVEVDRGNAMDFYPGDATPMGNDMWYKDLGAGLMINTEWFFVGVQLDNLFRHKDNIYGGNYAHPNRAHNHFVGTIGTDWVSRKENLRLSPYLVYQHHARLSEAWVGANLQWNWLTTGVALSSGMEPAATLGLKFDHFAVKYQMDYLTSTMTGQSGLSHQLSLRFVGKPSGVNRRVLNL